jgi:hypothetical protein
MPHAWRVPTNPAYGGKDSMYGHACRPVGRDTDMLCMNALFSGEG